MQESAIHFDENPQLKSMDVVCMVNLAAGQPKLILVCNDSDRFVLLSEYVSTESRRNYFNGALHVTAVVPLNGRITCAVSDDLGNYQKSKIIEISGKWYLSDVDHLEQYGSKLHISFYILQSGYRKYQQFIVDRHAL